MTNVASGFIVCVFSSTLTKVLTSGTVLLVALHSEGKELSVGMQANLGNFSVL